MLHNLIKRLQAVTRMETVAAALSNRFRNYDAIYWFLSKSAAGCQGLRQGQSFSRGMITPLGDVQG